MATKKSKLNSKLPKVSDIRFCTSAGKGLCTGVTTSGKFSIAVNFKQPGSRTAFTSYQIQYRQRDQYSENNITGWSAWSEWKNMKAMTKPTIAQGSTKDPNTWLKGNHGIAKTTYNQFWKWTNATIGGKYVQRQYQFRVRVYNGKNATHGAWVTSSALSIKRMPVIENALIFKAYNCIYFDYNCQWPDTTFNFYLNSIKDSKNRELLPNKKVNAVLLDKSRTASSTPPLRSGWVPAREIFDGLKRDLVGGEKLTINGYLQTDFVGSRAYLPKTMTVSKIDYEINTPTIKFATNNDVGSLTVRVYKSDADDVIKSGNIALKYTYNGKEYQQSAYKITKKLSVTNKTTPVMEAVFPFCPLNTTLNVTVALGNGIANKSYKKTVTLKTGRTWFVNKANSPSRVASLLVAEGDYPSFEIRSNGKSTVELAYGRSKPFAAFSPGTITELQIQGTATESSLGMKNMPKRSTARYWHEVRNDPGIYYLRGPNGEVYKTALREVQMNRGQKDTTRIIASFQEVS